MAAYVFNLGESIAATHSHTFQLLVSENDYAFGDSSSLKGKIVWVLVEEGGIFYLWARFSVERCEFTVTEVGDTHILIHADIRDSVYFLSSQDNDRNSSYQCSEIARGVSFGKLIQIDHDIEHRLQEIEREAGHVRRSMRLPPAGLLTSLSREYSTLGVGSVVASVLKESKCLFAVADLYRNPKFDDLNEYEFFTYCYVVKEMGFAESDVLDALTKAASSASRIGAVDLALKEIDPSRITSRKFESRQLAYQPSMDATENAEIRHQAILRDLALRVKERGFVPYETSSVDLVIKSKLKLQIVEIKSANEDNFLSQVKSGLYQLLLYAFACEKNGEVVADKWLVIETIPNHDCLRHAIDFLNYCGVRVLFFDVSVPWPKRVDGFDELLV